METNRTREDPAAPDRGDVGDVETAGETTAADTIEGPTNPKPVGEGTSLPEQGEVKDPPNADG
ncbi:MAG TPA: hypothetical protein VGX48_12870 [Pyrinomonadaceae bacterium]|jgi:hypothetical protein|nr:hypothetical protein [Pyrinomonadaceae bacterium]